MITGFEAGLTYGDYSNGRRVVTLASEVPSHPEKCDSVQVENKIRGRTSCL